MGCLTNPSDVPPADSTRSRSHGNDQGGHSAIPETLHVCGIWIPFVFDMQASDLPICWFLEKHSLNGGLSDLFDVTGLESYESVCCSDIFYGHATQSFFSDGCLFVRPVVVEDTQLSVSVSALRWMPRACRRDVQETTVFDRYCLRSTEISKCGWHSRPRKTHLRFTHSPVTLLFREVSQEAPSRHPRKKNAKSRRKNERRLFFGRSFGRERVIRGITRPTHDFSCFCLSLYFRLFLPINNSYIPIKYIRLISGYNLAQRYYKSLDSLFVFLLSTLALLCLLIAVNIRANLFAPVFAN